MGDPEDAGTPTERDGLAIDELFTSERNEALSSQELVGPDFDRASVPDVTLDLPDLLVALRAVRRGHPGVKELDPRIRDILEDTAIPRELADGLDELAPDELDVHFGDLEHAAPERLAVFAILHECKMRLELAYWGPLIPAGHRGEFTAHGRPLGEAMARSEALVAALENASGSGTDSQAAAIETVLGTLVGTTDRVREAMPREASRNEDLRYDRPVAAAPQPMETTTAAKVTAEPAPPRRFWTPARAAILLGVSALAMGLALWLAYGGPRDRAASYDGPGVVEHVYVRGDALQVTVPHAILDLGEGERLQAIEAIRGGLDVDPDQPLTFQTADGFPVADVLDDRVRLVTYSTPP